MLTATRENCPLASLHLYYEHDACLSLMLGTVTTECNKKWKWTHDGIGWCPGYPHAESDPDCGIL